MNDPTAPDVVEAAEQVDYTTTHVRGAIHIANQAVQHGMNEKARDGLVYMIDNHVTNSHAQCFGGAMKTLRNWLYFAVVMLVLVCAGQALCDVYVNWAQLQPAYGV